MIIDSPEYDHTLGDTYTGFIYQQCVYQYSKTSDWAIDNSGSCGNDKCETCPQDVCITNCEIEETYDEEQQTCVPCLEGCETGCIRDTDCRNCSQDFCADCAMYDTCESCIEGAVEIDGVCECIAPKFYLTKADVCATCSDNCSQCEYPDVCLTCEDGYYLEFEVCSSCDPACATCTDGTILRCGSCQDGYVHLPDSTVCVPNDQCPTGFTYDDSLVQCVSPGDVEYCFEWSDKQIEQPVDDVAISIAGDAADGPYANYQRGIYFSQGVSKLRIDGLVLNTSFTLEFWIKPESDGSLLHIDTYADFKLASLSPALLMSLNYVSTVSLTNEWSRVLYAVDAVNTRISICINEDCGDVEFLDPFVDSIDYEHTIGLLYTGYLYKFCVYQYVNYPLPIEPSDCEQGYCSTCPPGVCIINCPISTTLIDGECVECNNCPQGCIYPEDCTMCLDRYCETCSTYEDCEACVVNAEFNAETGECECDASHRPSEDFQCVDCHPACALCDDETNSTCDECNEGFYKQIDTRQCEEYCPTLLNTVDQECQTGPDKFLCLSFQDKELPSELAPSETSHPIPIYQRGIYFDGIAYVTLTDFVLNTSFSIEFYLWYSGGVTHGTLIEQFGIQCVWDFYVNAQEVKFLIAGGLVSYVPKAQIDLDKWISTALVVQPSSAEIYIDGTLADSVINENILFLDSPESEHRIGQGFIGMFYYVCISQFAQTTFEVPDPLPPSCPPDQTVDCEDCPEACENGCIRPTDCRTCLDLLCETCEDYDTCIECVTNAELDGVCTCNDPNYYQSDIDKCQPCPEPCLKCTTSDTCNECQDGWFLYGEICAQCWPDCETCRDSGEIDNCETCPDGRFMQPGVDICETTCPSGYLPNVETRICEASDNLDFCFEFSDKNIAQTSNGASTVLDASPDTDPVWILSRGIYFDGDDYLQITGLSLNSVSTVEFWIRPESSGTLLGISDIDVVYSLSNMALMFEFGTDQHTFAIVQTTWTHVAYVVDVKSISMYINNVQVYEGELNSVILDKLFYQHSVGIGYQGFIYKTCVKNYRVTSFEIEYEECVPDVDCMSCPVSICLSECNHDQFIEEDRACGPCLPECTDGCVRPTDCRRCEDELCASCSKYATCDTCIDDASVKPPLVDCTCDDPYTFSRDEGICRECHENCSECEDGTLECTQCQDGYFFDPNSNPDTSSDDCKQCNEACATCTDETTDSCPTCAEGYYKLPHTTPCVNYCPSLLLNENNECSEEPFQEQCFEFHDIQLPDGVVSSPTAPTPVYERGIWLDGTNVLILDQLVLSTHFTVEIYFRSKQGGELFSVTGGDP